MKTAKSNLCIVLRAERDGEYAHINGFVSMLDENDPEGFNTPYGETPLTKIRIRSQANRGNGSGLYGWSYGMDAPYYHVDLYEAKRMVATLTPIEKRMEKFAAVEGDARTFGQWINRLARAIGAKHVFIRQDKPLHNGSRYSKCDLSYTPTAVDRLVTETLAALNPQAISA